MSDLDCSRRVRSAGSTRRSDETSKEINELISASLMDVENGLILGDRTGAASTDIITKITETDGLVHEVSAS